MALTKNKKLLIGAGLVGGAVIIATAVFKTSKDNVEKQQFIDDVVVANPEIANLTPAQQEQAAATGVNPVTGQPISAPPPPVPPTPTPIPSPEILVTDFTPYFLLSLSAGSVRIGNENRSLGNYTEVYNSEGQFLAYRFIPGKPTPGGGTTNYSGGLYDKIPGVYYDLEYLGPLAPKDYYSEPGCSPTLGMFDSDLAIKLHTMGFNNCIYNDGQFWVSVNDYQLNQAMYAGGIIIPLAEPENTRLRELGYTNIVLVYYKGDWYYNEGEAEFMPLQKANV